MKCYFCGPVEGMKPSYDKLIKSETMQTTVCQACLDEYLPKEAEPKNWDPPSIPTMPTFPLQNPW